MAIMWQYEESGGAGGVAYEIFRWNALTSVNMDKNENIIIELTRHNDTVDLSWVRMGVAQQKLILFNYRGPTLLHYGLLGVAG